jgi:hypothetical protein
MVSLVEQALEDNIILICINVDAYDDPIETQQDYAISQHDHFLDRFYYLTTFRVNGFEKSKKSLSAKPKMISEAIDLD